MTGDFAKYKDNYYCLYKMITWGEFANLCEKLYGIYAQGITLQDAMLKEKRQNGYKHYVTALAHLLSGDTMIATSHTGANYRLNLAIRWLVRDDSPVDMGLWLECSKPKLS